MQKLRAPLLHCLDTYRLPHISTGNKRLDIYTSWFFHQAGIPFDCRICRVLQSFSVYRIVGGAQVGGSSIDGLSSVDPAGIAVRGSGGKSRDY